MGNEIQMMALLLCVILMATPASAWPFGQSYTRRKADRIAQMRKKADRAAKEDIALVTRLVALQHEYGIAMQFSREADMRKLTVQIGELERKLLAPKRALTY